MKKHLINAVVGLGFASIFLFLTLRNKPIDEIFSLLGEAHTGWIFASIIFLGLIFLLRSLRWQLFLSNSGETASLKNVSYSLLLGTFINAFTPKLGEVVRCTSLEKSTGISTSKAMGTVISDRAWDLVVLILGVLLVLLIESERLGSLVLASFRSLFDSLGNKLQNILLALFLIVLIIIIIWFLARKFGLADKIKKFGKGVGSTAKMTFRIKRSGAFTAYTLAIWAFMVLMNYACLKALPSTDELSLYFAVVALFIGTLGWAIPSPAGIGTSHYFILQLFIIFGLNEQSGIAYGILINGVQVIITIIAGALAVATVYLLRLIRSSRANNSEQ